MTHDCASVSLLYRWYNGGKKHTPEAGEIERIKNKKVRFHWDGFKKRVSEEETAIERTKNKTAKRHCDDDDHDKECKPRKKPKKPK